MECRVQQLFEALGCRVDTRVVKLDLERLESMKQLGHGLRAAKRSAKQAATAGHRAQAGENVLGTPARAW